MKLTINLQLNLCLRRVINDSEDGIHSTVHQLHQIEVETDEQAMYQRDVESLHEDFNQERTLPCSMMYGCAGCSRPTLCIVLLYEHINEELCLHCRSIYFSLQYNNRSLCLLQSVSSFHLIRHANNLHLAEHHFE